MADEVISDTAAPRASEARPTGIKTLLMEDVASSLRLLKMAPAELLAAEKLDELDLPMTRVLEWLHRHIATPPQRAESPELHALTELPQVFQQWHKLQQTMKNPMNLRLWMLWMELGSTLAVLHCCEAEKKMESCVHLVTTSHPPRDFPTSRTHCDKEKQLAFSCELWDAVVAKPLYGAPASIVRDAMPRLMEIFLHWMTTAMRGYELVFIANVATPLRGYIHAASTSNSLLADAWLKFVTFKMEAGKITQNNASVAVTALVLSALTSTRRSPEALRYLETLSAAMVDELSRESFPQPHSPIAVVALSLGISNLDDVRPPSNTAVQLQSGKATLLSQFAVLRLVNLQLLSSRLRPYDDATILDYQVQVQRRLETLVLEPSNAVLQEYSLRMTESCIEEMVGFFQSSREMYLSLTEAVQTVLPSDLFRPNVLNQLNSSVNRSSHEESLFASASEIVSFIKQFYSGVAPLLEVLSTRHLVRAFIALSRIEFAREVCASPTANTSMQSVTQQLELTLEQTATPPDTIFAPVLRSLAMHSMTTNSDIPPEADIVAGCQTLAVGLVVQRKLRILLFQCAPLIDDALAVVFSGLYNVFEPVDAFADRFLGICLSHLGQFTPLFTVFPHYLQVTLAAYPANASPQALTKACGTIFGSLFYSEALTMPLEQDSEIMETAQRMVLWAIRKCCERSTELLAEEDKLVTAALSTETSTKEAPTSSTRETDGLYLAGLVFELMKMAPLSILKTCAMEVEPLLARWKNNPSVLRQLKSALFARISQNCEAEKRAWLAAWYIEVDKQYPTETSAAATSRL
ncbi:hypothetical protein PC129_g9286 [Phytophthora cactorum]|uniref:Uncharacterized protein n=2 Tax=Phytophthora cactorum TaxID=29920 RepID=A0A329SCI9_9STRA|nr:hypothetical protein Pcac1_g22053 [Phytophthora cactorum]KAG2816218.1 hypothetical protein PC112_g13559 [Phytophthora cactorum]KAG2818084.1 hypothetical protein PC111_g12449 [Phytophthora cactorum]KAG2858979.1 hypothetical protein PC113_g9358 [Phytophthora cactorum]KAG2897311.1 hypothetical protein PC114_g14729 [Phytophthora cactorum]